MWHKIFGNAPKFKIRYMELNILGIINTLVEINTEWTGAAVLEIHVNDITEKAMKLVDVICKHYFNNIRCEQFGQQPAAIERIRSVTPNRAHCEL